MNTKTLGGGSLRPKRVLLVSKPVHSPFHDGSQVLVRNIANHVGRLTPVVMGTGEREGFAPHVAVERIYAHNGRFAPQLQQNVRPLVRLLRGTDDDLWHFVFAPNARSCRVIRALFLVKRRPTVQTIASPPRHFDDVGQLLFGDAVVAQSEWTARHLRASSPSTRPIEVIRPPVSPMTVPSADEVQKLRARLHIDATDEVITYPGDLEFSGGAQRLAEWVGPILERRPNVVFVFACRQKTPAATAALQSLQNRLEGQRVRFAGELPSLPTLLAASRLVVFPVEQLFAKVDIPIALLEAMQLGVPVVVPTGGPVAELTSCRRVALADPVDWVRACTELLERSHQWGTIRDRQLVQLESEFAAKVVAARYEDLYQRLLDSA